MKIKVKVKQVGRKYPLLENKEIEIDDIDETPLLRNFLKVIVKQQVLEFNSKTEEKTILGFLSNEEINETAEAGKVSFGRLFNDKKVEIEEAQETALLAFEDGLFGVFVGDKEIKQLNEKIDLSENKEVTFIRLTFLAGSYW